MPKRNFRGMNWEQFGQWLDYCLDTRRCVTRILQSRNLHLSMLPSEREAVVIEDAASENNPSHDIPRWGRMQ